MSLQTGQIVEYEFKLWRVGLVNDSRARLDPITGNIQKLMTASFTTYGASVNVSPGSPLPIVDPESLTGEQSKRYQRLTERPAATFVTRDEVIMPPVQPPVPGPEQVTSSPVQPTISANKKANAERKAKLAEAQAKQKANGKAGKAAKPPVSPVQKKVKELRPCVCGCTDEHGNRTMVTGFFAQGHDARFKGWMLQVERGKMKVNDLPEAVRKAFQWVKHGEGMIPTKNYKGEPHHGYDTAE